MLKKKNVLLFFIVSLLLLLAACSNKEDVETGKGKEKEQETGQTNDAPKEAKGDLNIAVSAQPPTLDPVITTATVALDITRNVYEQLIAVNADYEATPLLAESMEISDDGLTYTFKIRQGVKFHNGDVMTTEDVEASMNRWLGLSARAKVLLEGAKFVAVDDTTVELILTEVASDTLDIMAGRGQFAAIMPKEVIEAAGDEGVTEYVGTGPFKLEEWKQDQYVKLSKFDDYSLVDEPASGLVGKKEPLVENVYYYFVADTATRLAGLQTGEYHLADSMPYDNYEQLQNTDGIEAHISPDSTLNMFYNKKAGIMSDKKMRQAINMVIESDSVMRASFANEDLYTLNHNFMNPIQEAWKTDAGKEAYNQDNPEEAIKFAREAGYNDEEIRILVTRDYDHHYNAAIVVKEQLEQAGFKTKLDVYDWPTVTQKREEEEAWDIFFTATGYVTTPSQLLVLNKTYAGWPEDQKIDDLIDGIRSALDQDTAKIKWEELQNYIWNDYLSSTLFGHYYRIIGVSDQLDGYVTFEGIIPWNVSIK